jgi:hypothetical protein
MLKFEERREELWEGIQKTKEGVVGREVEDSGREEGVHDRR